MESSASTKTLLKPCYGCIQQVIIVLIDALIAQKIAVQKYRNFYEESPRPVPNIRKGIKSLSPAPPPRSFALIFLVGYRRMPASRETFAGVYHHRWKTQPSSEDKRPRVTKMRSKCNAVVSRVMDRVVMFLPNFFCARINPSITPMTTKNNEQPQKTRDTRP